MERVPTGCLLIHMSVFDKLPKPYFRFGINPENGDIIGEDFHFCDDARNAGVRIWCDAQLTQEMVHLGERGFRLSDAPHEPSTTEAAFDIAPASDQPEDERLVA